MLVVVSLVMWAYMWLLWRGLSCYWNWIFPTNYIIVMMKLNSSFSGWKDHLLLLYRAWEHQQLGYNEAEKVCVWSETVWVNSRNVSKPSGSQRTFNCSAQHTHFHLMDLNISNLSRHSLLTFLSSLYSLLSGERGREKWKKERARVVFRSPLAVLIWIDMILRFN